MGIEYVDSYVSIEPEINSFYDFSSSNITATNIADYHVFLDNIVFNSFDTSTKINSTESDWIVSLKGEQVSIHQLNNDYKLEISVSPLINELTKEYGSAVKRIPNNKMFITGENQHLKALMRIINLAGDVDQDASNRLDSIQFQLFISEN